MITACLNVCFKQLIVTELCIKLIVKQNNKELEIEKNYFKIKILIH